MPSSYFLASSIVQIPAPASIPSTTPPVFAGIVSATANNDGSITAAWAAGTTVNPPIEYRVYIALGSVGAGALFSAGNLAQIIPAGVLQARLFFLGNQQTYLLKGQVYTLGVWAADAYGNVSSNLAVQTATATGVDPNVLPTIQGLFATNSSDQLIGSFWATDVVGTISSPARLGTASYVIYDKNGNLVPGMAESGIVADAQGFFKITPVANSLDAIHNFYVAKVTITIDGSSVVNNVALTLNNVLSTIQGLFAINASDQLIASFWATDTLGTISNPARLGTASYEVYDKNGNLVPGMAQSGIVADAEGFFEITPVASSLDLVHNFYAVKVTIPIDGVNVVNNLPLTWNPVLQYEPRAVFSINPINQLEGTIWITKDSAQMTTDLGTASYAIYDKNGALVGISQSGIAADVNGFYKITPVSASLLTGLTHYTVLIQITANGELKRGIVGITIAE